MSMTSETLQNQPQLNERVAKLEGELAGLTASRSRCPIC